MGDDWLWVCGLLCWYSYRLIVFVDYYEVLCWLFGLGCWLCWLGCGVGYVVLVLVFLFGWLWVLLCLVIWYLYFLICGITIVVDWFV